mmetsp:Transcript_16897/g.43385  ORF Transcript_16897/g.43385 Transcript_16897/m.43385 type:complete len:146 (-) Transcript_16897:162-599(-)
MATSRPVPGLRQAVARGGSFANRDGPSLHTLRYAFKPESVDRAKSGWLRIASRGAVELRVPTASRDVIFNGHEEEYKTTELVLIRDSHGAWRLERLTRNVKNLTVARESSTARAGKPAPAQAAPIVDACKDAEVDAADLFGDDSD